MKRVLLALVFLALASGCLEPYRTDYPAYTGEGPYDNPNTTYYDTGVAGETPGECGYMNGPCCEYFGTDAFGTLTGGYYCNDGLECYYETCVEGPEYEAYDRTSGW